MSLKKSIHITYPHIQYPISKVHDDRQKYGLLFCETHDIKACNTHLEIKLRSQMVLASEITIQK
jgi:hypothetical protein